MGLFFVFLLFCVFGCFVLLGFVIWRKLVLFSRLNWFRASQTNIKQKKQNTKNNLMDTSDGFVFLLFFFLIFCLVLSLEIVLEECYGIIGFIVFSRWFQMSAMTLAYEHAAWVCTPVVPRSVSKSNAEWDFHKSNGCFHCQKKTTFLFICLSPFHQSSSRL